MPLNGWMEIPAEKPSFGLPPEWCGIAAADSTFLNHLLREHPEWTAVVEIGTSHGVTALALGMAMRCRGGQLYTVDIQDCRYDPVKRGWLDNMTFWREDALPGGAAHPFLGTLIASQPCLVICDGGDKRQEVGAYAPLLQPGSAFVVHDWGSNPKRGQSCPEYVRDLVERPEWNPLCLDQAEAWNSYFRGWIRVDTGGQQ